jgi:itaconate CoA-transferase
MNEMEEVWAHPQLMARGRWTAMGSPVGEIPCLRPPATHSDFDPEIGAVPAVGAHSAAILGELGYSQAEIDRLHTEQVF